MSEPSPRNREVGRLFAMSQVGMEMVGTLGLGLVVDHYFNISPWGLVVGTVVGFGGGIIHLVMLANQKDRAEKAKEAGGDP